MFMEQVFGYSETFAIVFELDDEDEVSAIPLAVV